VNCSGAGGEGGGDGGSLGGGGVETTGGGDVGFGGGAPVTKRPRKLGSLLSRSPSAPEARPWPAQSGAYQVTIKECRPWTRA
jgi:hypothetical protein